AVRPSSFTRDAVYQARRCRSSPDGRRHGRILGEKEIRPPFRLDDAVGSHRLHVQIERRIVTAKVHAHGVVTVCLLEHRGEYMLTRVLLHVVEASLPGYGTGDADRIAGERGLQYVCDAIAFVDDVG